MTYFNLNASDTLVFGTKLADQKRESWLPLGLCQAVFADSMCYILVVSCNYVDYYLVTLTISAHVSFRTNLF